MSLSYVRGSRAIDWRGGGTFRKGLNPHLSRHTLEPKLGHETVRQSQPRAN